MPPPLDVATRIEQAHMQHLQQEMIQRGIFGKVLHTSLLKACLTSEEQRALVLQGEETGLVRILSLPR